MLISFFLGKFLMIILKNRVAIVLCFRYNISTTSCDSMYEGCCNTYNTYNVAEIRTARNTFVIKIDNANSWHSGVISLAL